VNFADILVGTRLQIAQAAGVSVDSVQLKLDIGA
jgi:hypothetical protein